MMRTSGERGDAGFTLVELMVVLLILGILIAIAVASYFITTERTYRVTCVSNQRTLASADVQYSVAHEGAHPPTLQTLVDEGYVRGANVVDCPSDPANVHLDYDATTGDISCPLHPINP